MSGYAHNLASENSDTRNVPNDLVTLLAGIYDF